ncbi:hypothetical protein OH76DRAFT_1365222 [Lentinus brumalis]|uniref:Uncharacterized protein n=1 Tax=Lentinus brumalis TaxID=2498619 RepID=A0A371CLC1_9APHY|nr:hypothetical protein OH76DRAFT_1365222 [Polyporus brumalis]
MAVARRHVQRPGVIAQWGKVQRIDGGDLIHAADLVPMPENSRDASHVRYEQLVDRYAHNHRKTPEFEPGQFYGQLLRIFVLEIAPDEELGTAEPETIILAAIKTLQVEFPPDVRMPFYRKDGPIEVVDLQAIQCLVGRIYNTQRKWWAIIDRSSPYAQAQFTELTSA